MKISQPPRLVEVASQIATIQSRRLAITRRLGILEDEQVKLEDEDTSLQAKQHAFQLELATLSNQPRG